MLSFLALNLEMIIVFSFRGMSSSHSYISIWCCHYAFQTFYPQSIKYRQQCHCECLEIILQSDDRPFYRKTVHKYKYTVTVMSGGSAQGISLMDVYPFKHLSLKNSWCHISSAWEINLLACVSNIVNKSSTFKRQEADFIGPTTVVHLNRLEGRKYVNYYQHVSYWYHEPSWQTFSCNTSASRQTRQTNIYFQLMTQIWWATNSAKDVMFSPVCWSVGMSAGLHKTYRTDFHKTWVLAQNRPH